MPKSPVIQGSGDIDLDNLATDILRYAVDMAEMRGLSPSLVVGSCALAYVTGACAYVKAERLRGLMESFEAMMRAAVAAAEKGRPSDGVLTVEI